MAAIRSIVGLTNVLFATDFSEESAPTTDCTDASQFCDSDFLHVANQGLCSVTPPVIDCASFVAVSFCGGWPIAKRGTR